MIEQPETVQGAGSETSQIDAITKLQIGLMKATNPEQRGQHPKPHGCVTAEFEVLADLPSQLQIGLFASPAVYKALIRFSNGHEADDRKPDLHGMAIKLMEVPGLKVLETEASAKTHDFILADHPVFFIRDGEAYLRFIQEFMRKAPLGQPPTDFIASLQRDHPEDVEVFLGFRQQTQESPLASQYWSQVPYAFGLGGDKICRYSVVPRPGNMIAPIPLEGRDADYLRRSMIDHLTVANRPAYFEFMVQLRDDNVGTIIDQPTTAWETPLQRVAVLTIFPQTFDSHEQSLFGENLSYTPWHALPEHRPVGQINEIRKTVYLASTRLRHETNATPDTEPL